MSLLVSKKWPKIHKAYRDILFQVTVVTGRAKAPTWLKARNSLILGKDSVIGFREVSCNKVRVLGALQRDSEVYLRESFPASGNKTQG